jgi:8-oxo-dGTP diphosphatase
MAKFTYDYPRPSVTVDLVVFSRHGRSSRVLLVRRKREPYAGRWAIPGGFVTIDEPFEAAARRELKEEAGLALDGPIAFLGVFGRPGRDPRGRTISIAHVAMRDGPLPNIAGGDDAASARWVALSHAKQLAFDHDEILAAAKAWLRRSPKSKGSAEAPRYEFPFVD